MKNKIKKFLVKGNQDNRQSAGITLIALVITIVILLILAGISITMISKSSLLDKTKLASEKYKNKSEEEQKILSNYENTINNYNIVDSSRDTVTISKEEYENLKNKGKRTILFSGNQNSGILQLSDSIYNYDEINILEAVSALGAGNRQIHSINIYKDDYNIKENGTYTSSWENCWKGRRLIFYFNDKDQIGFETVEDAKIIKVYGINW